MRFAEKKNIAWLTLVLPLFLPDFTGAAENILHGEIALGQDYDSNINRDPSEEQSEWRSTITPALTLTRSEQTNNFSLKYAPTAFYSYLTDNTRVDQFASAQYNTSLTQKFGLSFQDTFVLADEPYADPASSINTDQTYDKHTTIQMSDTRGKNRYWTNNFTTHANFEYAQESFVKLGYQHHIFDNKDVAYADFVKQSPDISVLHRINHQWDTQLDYRFTHGNFDETEDLTTSSHLDESEDLTTHASDLYLYYKLTPLTKVFGHYGYSQTNYDGLQEDYNFHSGAAGTNHQFSPTLNLDFEGGMSLLQRDAFSDTDAVYLRIALNKTWERSSWSLSADSGLDEQQFSGTNDQGLSRYWAVKSAFNHTLIKDVTGTISLSYRDDTYLERLPEEKEQQLQGDALLAYSFAQWYQIAIRYTYINHDADIDLNQYDDSRIFLQLSAAKDLLKW